MDSRAPALPADAGTPGPPRPVAGTTDGALSDLDLHLFREGSHRRLYERLGAHPVAAPADAPAPAAPDWAGTRFAVWAPNARAVHVIGDWNAWNPRADPLAPRSDGSGIWDGFVANARPGHAYKFHLESRFGADGIDRGPGHGLVLEKADPFAFQAEPPPRTASRIAAPSSYPWGDAHWMASRARHNALDAPISIYELHLGSWMRPDGWRPGAAHADACVCADGLPPGLLNYRDIARRLADHVSAMGFTHVELLPVTEHPFYGSWGYQTTGYFAPTARYGSPDDFRAFVDTLHQRGIGVILDWVPSHFPGDPHGLARFDGTALFEHDDPRQGFHPDWNSWIFNYGRNEVRAFLASSAHYWLERFHIDAIRVDAVASMLYLDYGRKPGQWIPNRHGGHENLEAVAFLQQLNAGLYADFPDVQLVAEESTAWPGVSRPVHLGGLGFGMKWNMGWMHDTLAWFARDPIHRRHHQHQLTFSLAYAFNENYLLPLSHDEVVHGKGSLLGRMPGDDWQRFANLRLLLGLLWTHPGKKLLFMGGEFGQRAEWNHDGVLDWDASRHGLSQALCRWVGDLNRLLRATPALYELDFEPAGFRWVDASDTAHSVLAFLRHGRHPDELVLVVFNGTPVPRHNYAVGVPRPGHWLERLNSDASLYGGSGHGNLGGLLAAPVPAHGMPHSLNLTLPPLGLLVFTAPPVAG